MEFFTVTKTKNDELASKNRIFINDENHISGYCTAGRFVYSITRDVDLELTNASFNSIIRKNLGVHLGDTIHLTNYNENILPAASLTLVITTINDKTQILDYQECVDYFDKHFDGDVFNNDQLFLLDNKKRLTALAKLPTTSLYVKGTTQLTLEADPKITLIGSDQPTVVKSFNLDDLGIGGLGKEFEQIFRRAFISRTLPMKTLKKLNIKHVKGVLLYGPPGTGKTLIARQIGKVLNCVTPKIVNGPELLNKFVGGSEENVRKLFEDAEKEYSVMGESSRLHLIIFDEFDALCRQRGSSRDSTGVNDNVVTQLLSKIDGVNPLNNVLLIGMTNRIDLIDDAILRPGRFEVHVEIGLPDLAGRFEILNIHTKSLVGALADDVNLNEIAKMTTNYSGAELEGVVRDALTIAINNNPEKDPVIFQKDLFMAINEVKPAFGTDDDINDGPLIEYCPEWVLFNTLCQKKVSANGSLLLYGPHGSGRSSLARSLARSTNAPFTKVLTPYKMIGMSESQKINLLTKTFSDAAKSIKSCIVLDDIERLIEYSSVGPRFSNALLQTLMVLIRQKPDYGHTLVVIGTTAEKTIELVKFFDDITAIPLVPEDYWEVVGENYTFIKDTKVLNQYMGVGALLKMIDRVAVDGKVLMSSLSQNL